MFEAAAHRFVDLSEPGFGVALLNNAKYGHSVARQRARHEPACARRSIPIRSPTRATQSFTYALMPHAGDWHEGGVREEAEDLNQPLLRQRASRASPPAPSTPLAGHRHPGRALGAEAGRRRQGPDLRVYEPAGGRGDFAVGRRQAGAPSRSPSWRNRSRAASARLLPFEVRSWRLTR